MPLTVFLRGGGDLASGVALRLHKAGLRVIIAELAAPLAVRRLVSFGEAIYTGAITIEGVTARRVPGLPAALANLQAGEIPVLVDPQAAALGILRQPPYAGENIPVVLVDGRMTKRPPEGGREAADLVIGLGPGFVAGVNCHAVVETNRGHNLGRVIWEGAAEPDTGLPESVRAPENGAAHGAERVLRAPAGGVLKTHAEIGACLDAGQLVAEVAGQPVRAAFAGVLRGLLHPGLMVRAGMKIGDVDPRRDPGFATLVSDKALAVGGGVLEAILACPVLRPHLWKTTR